MQVKQRLLAHPWLSEVLLVGALTAAALALRLYRLVDIPPGFHGDEGAFGLEALKIARGEWLGIWTPVTLGDPIGNLYWMAFLFKLGDPSIFTVRLGAVLMGALTVPVAYLLFRLLFSRQVAFLTAALIAFSSWHLVFSRGGWGANVMIVFVLLLSLYLYFLGWRRGNWLLFVVGGILMGFGFYIHKSFPIYYGGIWVFFLLRVYFGASFRERGGAWLFLFSSLLAAIPFLVFFFQNQELFTERLKIESFFERPPFQTAEGLGEQARIVGDRIKEVFLFVHNTVPRDFVDGTGGRPLLHRATESFFWLGILTTIIRIRQPAYQLVAIGLLAGSVPAMLVVTGEQRRLLATMPFVMVSVALGLTTALQLLSWLLSRTNQVARQAQAYQALGRGAASLGLAGFLAFFSFNHTTYFFKDWAFDAPVKWVYVNDLVTGINYLKTLDEDTYVYFYAHRWSYNYETRQFLLPEMRGEDRSNEFGGSVTLERRHDGKVAYLLIRDYALLAPQIQGLYPGGEYQEVRDSDGSLIFAAYTLGAEEEQRRGAKAGGGVPSEANYSALR